MGGGKKKTPKVQPVDMPVAPAPAPPPEPTAQAPSVGGGDEGAMRHKERDAKKRGTSSLRIDLNVNGSGTAVPGGASSAGLSIPRG